MTIYLREWLSNPRLEILDDRPLKSDKFITHVIVVRNRGRTVALDCMAEILMDVRPDDVLSSSRFFKIKQPYLMPNSFRKLQGEKLCWEDPGSPVRFAINPALQAGISFYRVSQPAGELLFPSEGGWEQPRMVLKPRKYQGVIVISSSNAAPRELQFELVPNKKDVVPIFKYRGRIKSWFLEPPA